MKKEKIYKFDRFGLAQVITDCKTEKQKKINNITSLILIAAFLGFGWMSKEFFILYLTGKGIDFATDLLIK